MLLPQCIIYIIYSYCNKFVCKSRMEVLFFSRSRFQAESSCKQLCIGYLSELFINIHCDDEQTTPARLLYIVFTSFAIQSILPAIFRNSLTVYKLCTLDCMKKFRL